MKKLTQKESFFIEQDLEERGLSKARPIKRLTRKMLNQMIKKYKYHIMVELDYSYGNGDYAWMELYEEGIWDYIEKDVIERIKASTKYTLPLVKEFGRIYIERKKEYVRIYLYTRDIDSFITIITMYNKEE